MDGSDGSWWECLRALRACKELSQSFHEDRLTGLHVLTVRADSEKRSMRIVSSSSYFYLFYIHETLFDHGHMSLIPLHAYILVFAQFFYTLFKDPPTKSRITGLSNRFMILRV